jgi:hypothetical protein
MVRHFLIEAATRRSQTAPVADSQRSSGPLFKTRARGDSQRWLPRACIGVQVLDNETPQTVPSPSIAARAIDAATDVSRTIEEVTEGLRVAVDRLRSAIEAAQRPGQPLARLRAVTRQAPLTSLAIAFLLGAALTRRR